MVVGRLLSYWEGNFFRGYVKLREGNEHPIPEVDACYRVQPTKNQDLPEILSSLRPGRIQNISSPCGTRGKISWVPWVY